MNNLIEKLKSADLAYYTGESILDDSVYDELKEEAIKQCPDHPYFTNVGFILDPNRKVIWQKKKHMRIMGSQRKASNIDDLISKWKAFKGHELIVQEKLDGFSLEINYDKNGNAVSAITRGNGETGEDIFENVKKMKNFKTKIFFAKRLEYEPQKSLYCEVVMTYEDFDMVMKEYAKGGNKVSNPRNLAAGIAHREDGKYSEYLTIKYFDVFIIDGYDDCEKEIHKIRTLHATIDMAEKKTVKTYIANNLEDVKKIYEHYIEIRKDIPYQIDGLVIKINDLKEQEKLGFKNKRPQGQIALKFPSPSKITTLKYLEWTVSRTGRINPVAILEPVEIDGTIISRASAHNVSRIKELGIGLNCKVIIKKGGDIIPEIVEVISDKTQIEAINIPDFCPSCNEEIKEDDTFLWCTNDNCASKIFRKVINYCNVIGIENVGQSFFLTLFDNDIIGNIEDIYKVRYSNLDNLPGVGESTKRMFFAELERTKKMTLEKFLQSLGISNLSESTSKRIVMEYNDIDLILNLTDKELILIDGIGEKTAKQITKDIKKNISNIKELYNSIEIIQKKEQVQGILKSKHFCITGKLEQGNKKDYQKKIEALGGTFEVSVKKGLDYLVAADKDSISNKVKKAREFGITMIDEEELIKMLS